MIKLPSGVNLKNLIDDLRDFSWEASKVLLYFSKIVKDSHEESNILQNNDLISKLSLCQFASHIMEFDPWTGQFTTEQQGKFTLNEYTKETINMGESPEYTKEVPKLLTDETNQNLGSLPSRMITMVADRGLLDDDPTLAKNSEPVRWQREAYFRYQLLFTQILNMVVPLNTRLVAGDLIKVNFLILNI